MQYLGRKRGLAGGVAGGALAVLSAIVVASQSAQGEPARGDQESDPSASRKLSLQEALAAALPAADALAAARADTARAQAQREAARGGYLPQVTAFGSYQLTLKTEYEAIDFGPDFDLPFGQSNTWRYGLSGSQLLFDGGRTGAGITAARAGVQSAKLSEQAAKTGAVLVVAVAYYDAVLAERQLEIGRATLAQAEQTLASLQVGFRQGATPEFDVLRAEVARDNQTAIVTQATTQRDVSLLRLRRLLDLPATVPLTLTSQLDATALEGEMAAAAEAAGIAEAPATDTLTVALASQSERAAEAQRRGAQAGLWPTLLAVTDWGRVNYPDGVSPFVSGWRTNWTAGVNASWPLFDGLRRRAGQRAAAAALAAAQHRTQEAREGAALAKAEAEAAVKSALALWTQSERTVAQAKRAYEIAEIRHKQGSSTHLELVDARLALEQAALHQARSARDLRVARLRLTLLPGLPTQGAP